MTERGLNSWTDDLTARERVREIAMSLTQPQSVDWVRTKAQISAWQTAKDELEMLVEFGQLHAFEGDDGNTKYAPNYQRRFFDEVAELINDRSRNELREEIAAIQAKIEAWQTEFNIGSRDELEETLTEDDLTSDGIRERNKVLRQWEHYEDNKRLLKHALELYDDARALHPGRNESTNSSVSFPQ